LVNLLTYKYTLTAQTSPKAAVN